MNYIAVTVRGSIFVLFWSGVKLVFPTAAKHLLKTEKIPEQPVWFFVDQEQRRASQESPSQRQT